MLGYLNVSFEPVFGLNKIIFLYVLSLILLLFDLFIKPVISLNPAILLLVLLLI